MNEELKVFIGKRVLGKLGGRLEQWRYQGSSAIGQRDGLVAGNRADDFPWGFVACPKRTLSLLRLPALWIIIVLHRCAPRVNLQFTDWQLGVGVGRRGQPVNIQFSILPHNRPSP